MGGLDNLFTVGNRAYIRNFLKHTVEIGCVRISEFIGQIIDRHFPVVAVVLQYD